MMEAMEQMKKRWKEEFSEYPPHKVITKEILIKKGVKISDIRMKEGLFLNPNLLVDRKTGKKITPFFSAYLTSKQELELFNKYINTLKKGGGIDRYGIIFTKNELKQKKDIAKQKERILYEKAKKVS